MLLHARAALDDAVDVHVDGPAVSPELPPAASRWPHRVADLGPFGLVDAAAPRQRGPRPDRGDAGQQEPGRSRKKPELVLRDFAFDGAAEVTTLNRADGPSPLPGVAGVHLAT